MHRSIQNLLLAAYQFVFRHGVLRSRLMRAAFFIAYDYYKLFFEAGPIGTLRNYAPEGALVFDVGANIGFFTLRFANWVGPRGKVIAIEPEADNCAELRRRIRAKDYTGRVEVHQAAADAAAGTSHLMVDQHHPGNHRLAEAGLPIITLTLDQLREREGRPPALVKIDVQGVELRVLAGGEQTVSRDRPAVFIEIDPESLHHFGSNPRQLFQFFAQRDYRAHLVRKHTISVPLSSAECDNLIAQRGYIDVLFLPASGSKAD